MWLTLHWYLLSLDLAMVTLLSRIILWSLIITDEIAMTTMVLQEGSKQTSFGDQLAKALHRHLPVETHAGTAKCFHFETISFVKVFVLKKLKFCKCFS